MEQKLMMDALVQVKRMGNLLSEVQDVSRQLAEAVDRDDKVSVELLVNMRREPIEKLLEAEQVLHDLVDSAPDLREGRQLAELLNGGAAQRPEEKMLADLVGGNRRRLEQVLALDKVLNQKLTHEKSIYQ